MSEDSAMRLFMIIITWMLALIGGGVLVVLLHLFCSRAGGIKSPGRLDRIGVAILAACLLCFVNVAVWFAVLVTIGGSAHEGKLDGGRAYVYAKGVYHEVSPTGYYAMHRYETVTWTAARGAALVWIGVIGAALLQHVLLRRLRPPDAARVSDAP